MATAESPSDQEINQLLAEEWPRIQGLFQEHGIPEEASEKIVQETLLALLFRWQHISQPAYWLITTIRGRCEAFKGKRAGKGGKGGRRPGGGRSRTAPVSERSGEG